MKRLLILIILFLANGVSAEASSADLCEKKYRKVRVENANLEQILFAWGECEKYCPNDGTFESYVGGIYAEFHKDSESLKYLLNRASKYEQPPRKLLYVLCEAQLNNKLKQDALVTINKLIEEHPNWYGGFHLKGLYLGDIGDIEQAQRYFAYAYLEKEDGNNGWTLINLSLSNYHLGEHEKAVSAHILCNEVSPRIALFSQPGTDLAAISYIKTGRADTAAKILSIQAHYDESAVDTPAFKKALKIYEETTGQSLDVVAYYAEHCKS